ncbi:YibE/F family protein [Helcococcus ovis]|uniref:YibE/F family protein n=2 Tax=Helcococcus ovis TaxID=72026 RepID=A0A4R9C0R1_9FIRM|nr:YibE/F family protein [Helcococcus ovis]TFF65509.1 YibE/F family protein [Helcococcus ovis]TFF65747.1 YibE/F family protein [Helcococcus ovis]
MKKQVYIFLLLILILFSNTTFATNNKIPNNQQKQVNGIQKNISKFYKAKIEKIEKYNKGKDKFEKYNLVILDGNLSGKNIEINKLILQNAQFQIEYKAGQTVIIFQNEVNSEFVLYDHYRMTWVYYLLILFVFIVILIAQKAGLKSLITMFISIAMILTLIYLITLGYSPIKATIITSIINTIITLLIIGKFAKKTFAAILATIFGIFISYLIASIFGPNAHITGLSNENAVMMQFLPVPISAEKVLYSSMIIGALGAIMDVAMSTASSIEEISKADPGITFWNLFKSGMNVGKDIIGTMSNTLVLAYFASALPLSILIFSYNSHMPFFYNMDIFITEFVRIFAGSIGLVLVIPFSCFIATALYKRK